MAFAIVVKSFPFGLSLSRLSLDVLLNLSSRSWSEIILESATWMYPRNVSTRDELRLQSWTIVLYRILGVAAAQSYVPSSTPPIRWLAIQARLCAVGKTVKMIT